MAIHVRSLVFDRHSSAHGLLGGIFMYACVVEKVLGRFLVSSAGLSSSIFVRYTLFGFIMDVSMDTPTIVHRHVHGRP